MSFGSVAEADIECNRRERQFAINNSDDEDVRTLNRFLVDPSGMAYHAVC